MFGGGGGQGGLPALVQGGEFGEGAGLEDGGGDVFAYCDGFEQGEGGPQGGDAAVFHGPGGVSAEGAFDVVLGAALGGVG